MLGAVDAVDAVLDELIARQLADGRTAGIAVVATDTEGVLVEAYRGHADVAAGVPVSAGTVFEAGSISKVATAVLAVQLWQEGRLDLHALVRRYLPWLPAQPYAHVTAHRLLSHTAGFALGSDVSPPSPYMALAAVQPPPVPDAGFHYSDAGFQVMGLVIEAVTGRAYRDVLADGVLGPLGMADSFPAITDEIRPRVAVGYRGCPDDRPFHAGDGLAPAPWLAYPAADGSLACTARDLAVFTRMLAARGRGALTDKGFELLTTPVADAGDDDNVGYAVFLDEVYGYPRLIHGGDMVGYESWLQVDREYGLGVVTLTNGVADSEPVARGLLEALRAVRRGETPVVPPAEVPVLADYPGRYGGHVVDRADSVLRLDGTPLVHVRGDRFARYGDVYALTFGRADDGRVVEICHGPDWWPLEGEATPAMEPTVYCGQYRSYRPFDPTFRIVYRRGEHLTVHPAGRESRLEPTGGPGHLRPCRLP